MSALSIECPSCGAKYRVPPSKKGTVRCKKCGESFDMGAAVARARAVSQRSASDNKKALRLVIGGVVGLGIIVGIVTFASRTDSGVNETTKPGTNTGAGAGNASRSNPATARGSGSTGGGAPLGGAPASSGVREGGTASPLPPEGSWQEAPAAVGTEFLKALAAGDGQRLRELVWFDGYMAEHYALMSARRRPPAEEQYAQLPKEEQERTQGAILELIQNPERVTLVERFLLPKLEEPSEDWFASSVQDGFAALKYFAENEEGDRVMELRLWLKPRDRSSGIPLSDPAAWGLFKFQDNLFRSQRQIAAGKPASFVDIALGRARREELDARSGSGDTEATARPTRQAPVPGTPPEQIAEIEKHIAAMLDPNATVQANRAAVALQAIGKPAIPFLLNELIDRDHRENELDVRLAHQCTLVLRTITSQDFGYRPGSTRRNPFGGSQVTSTPEVRTEAVGKWFGWWRGNKTRFTGKKGEEEDDGSGGSPFGPKGGSGGSPFGPKGGGR